ncbi:MAG: aconitate hydratase AcnA, partial [Deltaproteobacteria bacterium]|nr:aconitate hydratase AcnA [Deltaproteobacteria bacterium]
MSEINTYKTHTTLKLDNKTYHYHSLKTFSQKQNFSKLPYSLKILLENLLRFNGETTSKTQNSINALLNWNPKATPDTEIQFMPARVLLQDFTGVPAIADLAAMRSAIGKLGGDPKKINPLLPADLVIDHSIQVDAFGSPNALNTNTTLEFERNKERYRFLKWGQNVFKNFRVVPPGTGIVHQVNLEHLSHIAITSTVNGEEWVYPDTLVGTDSHSTMVNGLGVLGWGVGGIEAEAALLGQPCSMLIPQVVGLKLTGEIPAGTTATDLVLTITQILRKQGVVGKFVEFFGPGLNNLSLADRATVANMAPEYGATVGLFPVDEKTLGYFRLTGRETKVPLIETYFKEQGLFYQPEQPEPSYSDVVELKLDAVEPSLAGPSRPQDRVALHQVPQSFQSKSELVKPAKLAELENGSVVIAAITSCTNTSNPSVLIAAGLLAKQAVEKGLKTKPWVKTSLAPGSKVVTDYLTESGLMNYLEKLGFYLIGYGCTTCIGNSGPLPEQVTKAIQEGDLSVAAVLSGNRNFEGRVHTQVRANYLASPPLVVAYALAGSVKINLTKEPIGTDQTGKSVYLKDIWPSEDQVAKYTEKFVTTSQFKKSYTDVFNGDSHWNTLQVEANELYEWDAKSTYIKEPPFFKDIQKDPLEIKDFKNGRVLAWLGDSVTTDHISPAGSFNKTSLAGQYLMSLGIDPKDFNSYGARRGNHEVMARGTFANVRLKNL